MIIKYGGEQIHDLTNNILDSSTRHRKLKGEDSLTLKFSLDKFIDVPIGSEVEYPLNSNLFYTLEKPANFKKKSRESFEYTLLFEGAYAKLRKYKFREKTGDKLTSLKFSLTGKPHQHLQMLIDNLNERNEPNKSSDDNEVWVMGKYVDAVEKTISYSHNNCEEVINMIANAFETEWEIDRKTINICKVEYNTGKDGSDPLPLSYGKGSGFKPGVGRSNFNDKSPVEILYVQGGERNINFDTYKSKELLLPKGQKLKFNGMDYCYPSIKDNSNYTEFDGREYTSSSDGLSIQRKDIIFNNEDSLDCPEIYPNRVGIISNVVAVNAEKNLYDIVDNEIPLGLDYIDYIIGGSDNLTIIFQSGMLAGKEFGVKYIHEVKGEKLARRFEIVPQEYDGVMMPDEIYKPKATVGNVLGDTYAVFNCMLPDEYICNNTDNTGASWDMFREAAIYLYENENPQFNFTGELDGIWAKRHWNDKIIDVGKKLKIGGYVRFSDTQFYTEGKKIRIVGIKENINNPHSPTIELSNTPVSSSISSDLAKIESNEVVVDNKHKEAIQYSKRRYRDAKETIGMLGESLLENFTNSINPITVETMSMLVGNDSLQFRFIKSISDTSPLTHTVRYDSASNKLIAPAGYLQHMTLDVRTISSEHKANEFKIWSLAGFDSPILEPAAKYWLYAKVTDDCRPITPQSQYTGKFVESDKAIKMNQESGWYYLLVGILNSEYDGSRGDFIPLYGFTEILPGRITTNKIQDKDAHLVIDLKNSRIVAKDGAEITGKITFGSGSSGLKEVAEWGELQTQFTEVKTSANNATARALGYDDYADMIENSEKGETVIIGSHLSTGLIEVNNLVANKVVIRKPVTSTKEPSIVVKMNEEGVQIGPISLIPGSEAEGIDEQIQIGGDENGINCVRLRNGEITGVANIGEGANQGTVIFNNSNIIDGTTILTSAMVVPESGSNIKIKLGLNVYYNYTTRLPYPSISIPPPTTARCLLYLYRDNVMHEQIGSAYASPIRTDDPNNDDGSASYSARVSVTVNKMCINVPSGSYTLVAVADLPKKNDPSSWVGSSSASIGNVSTNIPKSMTFEFIADIKRTELGNNGYMTAWNSKNYSITAWNSNTRTLDHVFRGGSYDVPGVLDSASVSIFGGKSHQWGARGVTTICDNPQTGKYTVYHKIGHLNYTVTASPDVALWGYSCSVSNQTATSFDVYIGRGTTPANGAFKYICVGSN